MWSFLKAENERMARVAKSVRPADRRSPSRLLVVPGWSKLVPCGRGEGRAYARRSVAVWVGRTQAVLSSSASLGLLSKEDWSLSRRLGGRAAMDSAIATRLLLRLALSNAVRRRVEPRDWQFTKTSYGKPIVCNSVGGIEFSVSHVDELAVVAVGAGVKLGIDIESIDQDVDQATMSAFTHAEEQRELVRVAADRRARRFLTMWTQKEAYTKLLGRGHSIDFSSINCGSLMGHGTGSPLQFESFFVPTVNSIYQAFIALQREDDADASIEIQLMAVHGPSESTWLTPAVNGL
jgi:phosphopantetheinyl transferase